jgi:hypothetical protein
MMLSAVPLSITPTINMPVESDALNSSLLLSLAPLLCVLAIVISLDTGLIRLAVEVTTRISKRTLESREWVNC